MFLFFCLYVQYNYRNRGSLTFEPLTLVPIQVKMMNTELLTQKEVRFWYSDKKKNLYMYTRSRVVRYNDIFFTQSFVSWCRKMNCLLFLLHWI